LNCQKDAFETAADTLEARGKEWGIKSALLKIWVDAQDQVFANCSEGKHIPDLLPANADPSGRLQTGNIKSQPQIFTRQILTGPLLGFKR